ncbi:unnamed protein product, partial [Ilex paraguariensis]
IRVQFINNLILQFCDPEASWQRMGKCLHVLDIHRKSLGHVTRSDIVLETYYRDSRMSRLAKQLYDAGVIIKRSDYSSNKFSFEGRILSLLFFTIDDNTESTFLNMIAFECCHVEAGSYMTTFASWNPKGSFIKLLRVT